MEHPEIPIGNYCYNYVNGEKKLCPHWEKTENGARCNFLNVEHYEKCCFHLVWDQCKHCLINENKSYTPIIESDEELKNKGFELKTITCKCNCEIEIWEKRKV